MSPDYCILFEDYTKDGRLSSVTKLNCQAISLKKLEERRVCWAGAKMYLRVVFLILACCMQLTLIERKVVAQSPQQNREQPSFIEGAIAYDIPDSRSLAHSERLKIVPNVSSPFQSQMNFVPMEKKVHRWLLINDAEYRKARTRKLTGILVSSIGGGLGVAAATSALVFYGYCQSWNYTGTLSCDHPAIKYMALGGALSLAISLSVGLPLALSGHETMKRIRKAKIRAYWPRMDLSVANERTSLMLGWTF